MISVANERKQDVLTYDSNQDALEITALKEKFKVGIINDADFLLKIKNKLNN